MGLGKRYEVVDIELSGIDEFTARERIVPQAAQDPASSKVQRDPANALRDQHLLAGVLAIAVGIDPVIIQSTVVWGRRGRVESRNRLDTIGATQQNQRQQQGQDQGIVASAAPNFCDDQVFPESRRFCS